VGEGEVKIVENRMEGIIVWH